MLLILNKKGSAYHNLTIHLSFELKVILFFLLEKMEASDSSNVVVKKNPVIQFSRHILKTIVGNEKA